MTEQDDRELDRIATNAADERAKSSDPSGWGYVTLLAEYRRARAEVATLRKRLVEVEREIVAKHKAEANRGAGI